MFVGFADQRLHMADLQFATSGERKDYEPGHKSTDHTDIMQLHV